MRLVLGTLLLALTGCHSCGGPACGPCGSPGGAACGPIVCVECCHYNRRLDDLHTEVAARRCACEALTRCGAVNCDYRHGFTKAYVDLALGGTGTPPPVPPERYWSVCFRTSCGEGRAADWYAGYRDGVASARGGESMGPVIPASGVTYVTAPGRPPAHDGQVSGNADWQFNGSPAWDGMPTGVPYGPSQYGPSQYGPSQYGPSQYGPSQYGASQFGGAAYGSAPDGGGPYSPGSFTNGPYGGDPYGTGVSGGWQGSQPGYGQGYGSPPGWGYR